MDNELSLCFVFLVYPIAVAVFLVLRHRLDRWKASHAEQLAIIEDFKPLSNPPTGRIPIQEPRDKKEAQPSRKGGLDMNEKDELVALRCKSCGAPLEASETGYLCAYCGTAYKLPRDDESGFEVQISDKACQNYYEFKSASSLTDAAAAIGSMGISAGDAIKTLDRIAKIVREV